MKLHSLISPSTVWTVHQCSFVQRRAVNCREKSLWCNLTLFTCVGALKGVGRGWVLGGGTKCGGGGGRVGRGR